jgi:hypothetical protein
MAKKKSSKHKRSARSTAGSAQQAAPVQSRTTYWFVRIAPFVIAAISLALYFGAKSTQAAAAVGVLGVVVWLAVALGSLGSTVPPRDSTRGGAIDFGKRQN